MPTLAPTLSSLDIHRRGWRARRATGAVMLTRECTMGNLAPKSDPATDSTEPWRTIHEAVEKNWSQTLRLCALILVIRLASPVRLATCLTLGWLLIRHGYR